MNGPTGWSLDPVPVACLAVLATAYAIRARNLAHEGRPVPIARQVCFHAGMLVLLLALVSPVDTIGENRVFYMHMVQHLMLGDLAPLLIVLGLTGPILRPVLALPGLGRLRVLAHPLVALPLWAIAFYAWHLPPLYQAALTHPVVHDLEHLCFLGTGLLMWAVVVEPLPGPAWFGSGAKAAYVLVVRTLSAVLATIFIWAGTPLYPHYAAGERLWGISPGSDQVIGGAIMFIEGATVTVIVFVWLFLRWLRESELEQALLDTGHGSREAGRAARFGRRRLTPEPPPTAAPRR